jgi:hypothetical protein
VMEESWWGQPPRAAHYVTRAREIRSARSAGRLTPMIYEIVRWKYVYSVVKRSSKGVRQLSKERRHLFVVAIDSFGRHSPWVFEKDPC